MPVDTGLSVLLGIVVVIAAMLLMGRTKATRAGEFNSDSLSFIGGLLNAVFVVVLAFYVVFAWQRGDDIDSDATGESNALSHIYWEAAAMPHEDGIVVRSLLTRYANEVVQREWGMLAKGDTDSAIPHIIDELESKITALPTSTAAFKTAREQALTDARQLADYHKQRIADSVTNDNFTNILLAGTIIGAIIMAAFPILVGITARGRHVTVMTMMTVTLGVLVYFSVALMNPLQGMFGQDPEAFRDLLTAFAGAR